MHCFRYGVVFHGMRDNHLEVTFHGEMRRYKLLHVLEFDATRKRMSVIIQTEKGGCLCVFTCYRSNFRSRGIRQRVYRVAELF